MVCKEEVLSWFKELESYRRIDAMCALLNMCLPFELRFLGTYLEELGKRDFQELRGAEARANSQHDLASELAQELAAGAPAQPPPPPGAAPAQCSRPAPAASPSPSPGAANAVPPRLRRKMALYVSLLRSCNYACAATLYQVMFGLERAGLPAGAELRELLLLYTMALHHPAFTFDMHAHFRDMLEVLEREEARERPAPRPSDHSSPPECPLAGPPPPTRIVAAPLPPEATVSPSAPGAPPPMTIVYLDRQHPMAQGAPIGSGEIVGHAMAIPTANPASGERPYPMLPDGIAPPPGIRLQPYPVGEYVVGHPHWPAGMIVARPLELIDYRVPSPPIASQSSSPGDSRSGSPPAPGRQGPKSARRSSRDAISPPRLPHRIVQTFDAMKIAERPSEDDKIGDPSEIQPKTAGRPRTIEIPNGLRIASRYAPPAYVPRPSSGSESGSSTGSRSPPETPAPVGQTAPMPGRPRQPPSPQYTIYQHFPRTAYATPYPAYRPSYYPVNGEPPVYGGQQYAGYVHVPFAPPPPKLSCWNCGAAGHSGSDCKEPSIEEVTHSGRYQLDYSSNPPDVNEK